MKFLGSRSIRTRLVLAFSTLLALGALNIAVYYWGASRRSEEFDQLQRALERQALLQHVVGRLEDQKRLVDLAAGALGAAEAPRNEERVAFARDLRQVTDSMRALRAHATGEEADTFAVFERNTEQLAAQWIRFYNSLGVDPSAAVVASVEAEPIAHRLLTMQLPDALEREDQRVNAASAGFMLTDRTVSRVAAIIFLLSALLGGLAAYTTSRHVLSAVRELRHGVERIGAGDLEHRITVTNRDELGEIADRFNDMAERLRVRRAELQQINTQLGHEIGERRSAQGELQIAKEAAEAANAAKSSFLANMSHELRTPLNAIIGYSEMLIEEASEDESAQPALSADLDKIRSAGKHLLGLINDILDLSKIEAGKMELHAETFDVSDLLREVADTVEPLIGRGQNVLERKFASNLGLMLSDPVKVREVLLNLLGNSAKFTERGTIVMSAERSTHDGRAWITFSVADSGIGMSPDQMVKLFQPFTQVSADGTRKYGGTGLGLAITKRFVEMMGGEITLDSAPAVGTTFTVHMPAELPAAVTDQPLVAQPKAQAAPETDGTQASGMVLIIDDDMAARDVLARTLRREGFDVITASDGQEGLRLAHETKPDVITLDVLMPGQDGWEVLRGLKDDPTLCDVPVVMVTMLDERTRGLQAGAAEYLVKPVDRERLLGVLRRQLGSGTHTVLVIDDDSAAREMVARMLRREGWSVVEAADGHAGLEMLEHCKPSIVLLDLLMPGVDGFEFLDRLDAAAPVPIVVLTAKDLTNSDVRRLSGRVRAVLQKASLRREDLLQEVRRHMSPAGTAADL